MTDGVARCCPEHDIKLLTYGSFVDVLVLVDKAELKFCGALGDFARL